MANRYRIYRNLHNGLLSIKDVKTGLVCGYSDDIILSNCKFVVLPSGKRLALKTNTRNVHAFVEGEIVGLWNFAQHKGRVVRQAPPMPRRLREERLVDGVCVSYNPFKEIGFYKVDSEEEIKESKYVTMRIRNNRAIVESYDCI